MQFSSSYYFSSSSCFTTFCESAWDGWVEPVLSLRLVERTVKESNANAIALISDIYRGNVFSFF